MTPWRELDADDVMHYSLVVICASVAIAAWASVTWFLAWLIWGPACPGRSWL